MGDDLAPAPMMRDVRQETGSQRIGRVASLKKYSYRSANNKRLGLTGLRRPPPTGAVAWEPGLIRARKRTKEHVSTLSLNKAKGRMTTGSLYGV